MQDGPSAQVVRQKLSALLEDARTFFRKTQMREPQARVALQEGRTFGDPIHDLDLPADKAMGYWFERAFQEPFWEPYIRSIVVEGGETVALHENAPYVVYVDPLDNSQGYHATMGMPEALRSCSPHAYAAVVTIISQEQPPSLRSAIPPTFAKIRAAGVVPLHPGAAATPPFVCVRGAEVPSPLGAIIESSVFVRRADRKTGLNATIVFEGYYPENRAMFEAGFRDVMGALRSLGCAALEMIYPSIGATAGFVCSSQKMHELGAAWLFAQQAGIQVFTWDVVGGRAMNRRELDQEGYNFHAKKPVVFAESEALADDIWDRLQVGYERAALGSS